MVPYLRDGYELDQPIGFGIRQGLEQYLVDESYDGRVFDIITGDVSDPLIIATGNTDLIYVGATLLFFGVCIAYAAWCERL